MCLIVLIWGYEYVVAKSVLLVFSPLQLVFMKFCLGFLMISTIKIISDRRFFFRKKDIPLLILCALVGELIYFACEYGAMDYLPVSVITIVLAFIPAVSVITEYLLFKTKANFTIVFGIIASIVGVALVIGGDFRAFLSGGVIGYLLIFGAVFSWNVYNFMTKGLTKTYKPLDLTMYQTFCTALLALPFLIHNCPPPELWTIDIWTGLLFIGAISEGVGFVIYVNAIHVIGPTPCSVYSNMLPVATTIFGWILLGEHIGPVQIAGGIIVMASGFVVIWQKGKLDAEKELQVSGK
jgi:drug/metabolite transporter (DMT)-like permease